MWLLCVAFWAVAPQISVAQTLFRELSSNQQKFITEVLGEDSSLEVISFEMMKSFPGLLSEGDTVYLDRRVDGYQVVTPSNDLERKIIEKSDVSGAALEIGTVRAHRKGETVTFDDFFSGTATGMPARTLESEFKKFLRKFADKYPDGKLHFIEYIHSHPRYDAKTNKQAGVHPLHVGDFEVAMEISRQLAVPVLIVAVVPNGYSYRALIFGKDNLSFGFFK